MSTTAEGQFGGAHEHSGTVNGRGFAAGVLRFFSTYVFSRDHKIIGLQFLFSTMIWFLAGGLLALAAAVEHEHPLFGGAGISSTSGRRLRIWCITPTSVAMMNWLAESFAT